MIELEDKGIREIYGRFIHFIERNGKDDQEFVVFVKSASKNKDNIICRLEDEDVLLIITVQDSTKENETEEDISSYLSDITSEIHDAFMSNETKTIFCDKIFIKPKFKGIF